MDKEQYCFTLNSLACDCESLQSATVSLEYLFTIGEAHPDKAALTPEMQNAFKELAAACSNYLATYNKCAPIAEQKKPLLVIPKLARVFLLAN